MLFFLEGMESILRSIYASYNMKNNLNSAG